MSICYVDTSALAKRYFNEPYAEQAEVFLAQQSLLVITLLTAVEMRSLTARRRRAGELDATLEAQIFASFREDVRLRHLVQHEITADTFAGAVQIISQLPDVALRTLDALHLAAAQQLGVECLVTADRRMSEAASGLAMPVKFFGLA